MYVFQALEDLIIQHLPQSPPPFLCTPLCIIVCNIINVSHYASSIAFLEKRQFHLFKSIPLVNLNLYNVTKESVIHPCPNMFMVQLMYRYSNTPLSRAPQTWDSGFRAWNKIEGLLPLFWGPTLHIPFKIFCNPSKRKG